MSKRGRPKLHAARTPSGQISRARDVPHVPVHLVRAMVSAGKIQGKWLTYFGRMALEDRITQKQFDAGERFADAWEAYRDAIDAPGLTVPAQDLNKLGGRDNVLEDVSKTERAIKEWDRIKWLLSPLEMDAMTRLCVKHEEQSSFVQIMALKYGLDKLIGYWSGRR